MAHHGSSPFDPTPFKTSIEDMAALFGRAREASDRIDEITKLGATGRFPEGKLTPEDEGEIAYAIGQQDGKVVINFGKPTHWIGFTAEQAEDLATTLREHATECRLRRSPSENNA